MKKLLGFTFLFIAIIAIAANQNSTAILGSPSYLIESMANIVTSGGTTTLTSASLTKQAFTGSSAQTVQLPPGTTLQLGRKFLIINGSSNTITVNDAGSNLLSSVSGPSAEFTLKDNTTSNGVWSVVQVPTASSGAITALTTDVVAGPGPTAAATIQPNVVSNAKLAQMAANSIKGNNTGSTANAADLTVAQTNTLLGDILANGTVPFSGNQSMGSNKLTSVTDPTSAQDAATKNYVDSVASGLNPKQAVYAASTGNIVGTYSNGVACVGATFTITATGALSLDGTSPAVGSRVLLKDQSSGFQNGVYDVTVAGTTGVSPILTRSLDYNTSTDMNAGDLIPVINGTANAVTSWLQTSVISTCGSDSLTFTEWSYNPAGFLLKANNLSDVSVKATSFNNLSPMSALGDIIIGGASGTGTRLAPGSAGQVLTMNATQPTWSPAASGGSGITSIVGDVVAPGPGPTATSTIQPAAVTYAKIQNANANTVITNATATSGPVSETALAASQLLGRGSSGNITAISPGTSISISGTTIDTISTTAGFMLMGPSPSPSATSVNTGPSVFRRPLFQDFALVAGSVWSGATGAERVERADIANNGTATITSQSGSWLSSATETGTGLVTLTVNTGVFSATPACSCTAVVNGGAQFCVFKSLTSTSIMTQIYSNAGVLADREFMVLCQGPR